MLLGAWLAGSLLLITFTRQNARTVDEVVSAPAKEALDTFVKLETPQLKIFLNYHSSEVNRWLTRNWEIAELCLGSLMLVSLFLSADSKRVVMLLCFLMLATAIFLHWFMTPQIDKLARTVLFLPAGSDSVSLERLRSLETGYSTAATLKMALGFLAMILMLRRGRRSHRQVEAD